MNEEKLTLNSGQELKMTGLSPLALDVNQLLWPTSLEHSYIPTSFVQASCGMSSSLQYDVPSTISTATAVSTMQTSQSECKSPGVIWMTQASKSATTFPHDNHIDRDTSIMDSKSQFNIPELIAKREFCQMIGTTSERTGKDEAVVTSDSGISRKRRGQFEEETEVEHQDSNDVSYNNTLNSKMPVNSKNIVYTGDNPMKHPNEDHVVSCAISHRGDTEPEVSNPVRKLAKPFKKAYRKNKEKPEMIIGPKDFGKLETVCDSIIDSEVNEDVGHFDLLSSPSTFDLQKIEDVQRKNAVKGVWDIHMTGLNPGIHVNGENGQKTMLEEFKQVRVDLNDPKTNGNDGHFDLLSSPSTFDLHQIEDVQRKHSIITGVGDFHRANINTEIQVNGTSEQKMILEEFKQLKVDLNNTKLDESVRQFELTASPSIHDLQQIVDVRKQNDDVNCVVDFQMAYLSSEISLNGKSGQALKHEVYKQDKRGVQITGNDMPQRNENDSRMHANRNEAKSDTEAIEGPSLNSSHISCDNGEVMEPTCNSFDARTNYPHKNADCPLAAEHNEANLDDSDIDAISQSSQITEESRETDDGDSDQERNDNDDTNLNDSVVEAVAYLEETHAFGDDSLFGILGVYCSIGLPCWYDSDATNQNDTAEAVAYLEETHPFGDDSVFGILGVYCRDRKAVEER